MTMRPITTELSYLRALADCALRLARRQDRYAIALDEIAHRDGLTAAAMRQIATHALAAREEAHP